MEFWSTYESITTAISSIGGKEPVEGNYADMLLWSALIAISVGLVFFILQGFALYVMAKKRRFRYKWLAFIPFANIMLMGRLAGETTFFGQKIKRAGLYAMIAQIVITVLACSYIFSDIYLHQNGCIWYEPTGEELEPFRSHWNTGTRFEKFLYGYWDQIAPLVNGIFSLLSQVLMLTLLASLYKKYSPEGYMWMLVVSFLVPFAPCIILLVLRNRRAVDYRAYMQAKRDAYMRRNQQYYGQGGYNSYGGSPYGNPQQGYGPQGATPQRPEDPFAEFSSGKKSEDPFVEFSSGKKSEDPFAEFSSGKKDKGDGDEDGFFD